MALWPYLVILPSLSLVMAAAGSFLVAVPPSRLNQRMGPTQLTLRSRAEFARFFDGLDMVEPGVVPLAEWRALADPAHTIPAYAGIGRKR